MTIDQLVERQGSVWIVKDPKELWKTIRQASAWVDLVRSGNIPETEVEIIDKYAPDIAKLISSDVSIVDLGAGEGTKGVKISAALRAAGLSICYIPIDANETLLFNALEEAGRNGLPVVRYNPCDFFEANYRQIRANEKQNILYLLLGNINYPIDKIIQFLNYNMHAKDAAIIGTELLPSNFRAANIGSMLESYRTNEAIANWFSITAVDIGFARHQIVYNPRFNFTKLCIEHSSDITDVPPVLALKGSIKPGDRLVYAYSLRPRPSDLEYLFSQQFNVDIFTDEAKKAALVCLRPKAD